MGGTDIARVDLARAPSAGSVGSAQAPATPGHCPRLQRLVRHAEQGGLGGEGGPNTGKVLGRLATWLPAPVRGDIDRRHRRLTSRTTTTAQCQRSAPRTCQPLIEEVPRWVPPDRHRLRRLHGQGMGRQLRRHHRHLGREPRHLTIQVLLGAFGVRDGTSGWQSSDEGLDCPILVPCVLCS